jgi:hypothetical protein
MIVYKVDQNGFEIDNFLAEDKGNVLSVLTGTKDGQEVWEDKPKSDYVLVPPAQSFYKRKWNGSSWIEGLSQTEINAILNAPKPETVQDKLDVMQKAIDDLILGGL